MNHIEDEEFDLDLELGNYNEESIREHDEALTECLKEEYYYDRNQISIINPTEVKNVRSVCDMIKRAVQSDNVKVTSDVKINEPNFTRGYVSISGKNIRFLKPHYFEEAAKIASNVEIYPKTDGTIQINFTFNDVVSTFEEVERND